MNSKDKNAGTTADEQAPRATTFQVDGVIGVASEAIVGASENSTDRPGEEANATCDDHDGGAGQSTASACKKLDSRTRKKYSASARTDEDHEPESGAGSLGNPKVEMVSEKETIDDSALQSNMLNSTTQNGSRKRSLPGDGGSGDEHKQPKSDSVQVDTLNTAANTVLTEKRHHHRHRRRHHHRTKSSKEMNINGEDQADAAYDSASEVLGQEDKLKLLLEYIPYFGTGDTSRDNMVRSILSAANPQELAGDRDEYKNTLLILACQYQCKGLAPMILARGGGAIDVNAVNSSGACALHFACYKDSICVETAMLLLERGAQPEITENMYGCTPLHYAAGTGDLGLCKRLVGAGAKASTCDFYNYTAVDYAKQSGAGDCIAYFEEVSKQQAATAEPTTVKISIRGVNRGGIVTRTGDDTPMFGCQASCDTADGESTESPADPIQKETRPLAKEESSPFSYGEGGGTETVGRGYWEKQRDPATGMMYYLNDKTGESMWEKDLLTQAKALGGDEQSGEKISPQLEEWLKQQAHRARLIAFLGRHDPLRLTQVDEMLKKRLGQEGALFKELGQKHDAKEDPLIADLSKDAIIGFRGRNRQAAAADALQIKSFPVAGGATLDARVGGGGGRPPTAPSHGPGRRTGGCTTNADGSPCVLGSPRNGQTLVSALTSSKLVLTAPAASDEEVKKLQEQTQERLDKAKTAHEETLEAERQAYRDRAAEGEGTIARLELGLEKASTEVESLNCKLEESKRAIESLAKELEIKQQSQSGALKELSEEAEALRIELKSAVESTRALAGQADREQSGAVAAAESSRREAEAKAKEESDLVHTCQVTVAQAKADADRSRRDFANLKRTQEQEIQERLENELVMLQRELTMAKPKAATDISRAQNDAVAAKSKAEAVGAIFQEIEAQRNIMQAELERSSLVAKRNVLLQGLISSESQRRKMLHNKIEDLKGKIRVYVRVRPFSQKERERGCKEAVDAQGQQSIAVQDPRVSEDKNFDFDQVWSGTEEQGNNQINIFKDTGYLVTSAVDGYNVCIFAYGQTGSGKTYTMFGAGGVGGGVDADTGQCDGTAGVTPRAVLELFRVLKEREGQYEYSVKVSMFELYRDGLRDLLCKKGSNLKLVIKLAEHSGTGLVVVEGGTEKDANTIKQMIDTIQLGAEGRTVSSTQMNSDSSRSHLLCSIVVSSTNRRTGSRVRGKLTLVDLAGSERVGKSGAAGDQLKEAQSINKSLSALGDVIGALTTGVKHIPYRNHALTMMMSDSLGGNSKTLMFVCASPADYNASETINALQFAARCKSVTNSAGAGGAGGGAAAAQVQALRRELQKLKGGGGDKEAANTPIKLARPV